MVDINVYDIRSYSHDKHHTVDDYPYGGGAGMVMKPEPIFEAVEDIKKGIKLDNVPIVLLTPQGRLFNQECALQLSREKHLIIICGHYEGIDDRVAEHLATDEISIGDYLMSGGEAAAMVIIDSVVRLIPGVIDSMSLMEESHVAGLLEYPQYTRPPEYRGWKVPEVLLSGNHKEISLWRKEQSLIQTWQRRPDLFNKAELSDADKKVIKSRMRSLRNN